MQLSTGLECCGERLVRKEAPSTRDSSNGETWPKASPLLNAETVRQLYVVEDFDALFITIF